MKTIGSSDEQFLEDNYKRADAKQTDHNNTRKQSNGHMKVDRNGTSRTSGYKYHNVTNTDHYSSNDFNNQSQLETVKAPVRKSKNSMTNVQKNNAINRQHLMNGKHSSNVNDNEETSNNKPPIRPTRKAPPIPQGKRKNHSPVRPSVPPPPPPLPPPPEEMLMPPLVQLPPRSSSDSPPPPPPPTEPPPPPPTQFHPPPPTEHLPPPPTEPPPPPPTEHPPPPPTEPPPALPNHNDANISSYSEYSTDHPEICHPDYSPPSSPPPLPKSSPPPLDHNSDVHRSHYQPTSVTYAKSSQSFSSFRGTSTAPTIPIVTSSPHKPLKRSSYDSYLGTPNRRELSTKQVLPQPMPMFSPIEEEAKTATIRGRVKPSRLPLNLDLTSSSSNLSNDHINQNNKITSRPVQRLSNPSLPSFDPLRRPRSMSPDDPYEHIYEELGSIPSSPTNPLGHTKVHRLGNKNFSHYASHPNLEATSLIYGNSNDLKIHLNESSSNIAHKEKVRQAHTLPPGLGKSIFDGATKGEILEILKNAKKRLSTHPEEDEESVSLLY